MKFLTALLLASCLIACKGKKKETKDTSRYFPIKSYLQSRIKGLDTSLYRFVKIETTNGHSDTSDISREEASEYAKEFLNIPDLKDPDQGSDYEEMSAYDSLMNRAIWSYTAYDKDVDVLKLDVTVIPKFGDGEDEVKTVYIEKFEQEGDKTIDKKMLWEMKEYFNIRTIIQENNKEQIKNLKVAWNASTWNN
jgi:hypothetical protein